MITAHGATLTVTNEALTLTPTALAASLRGGSESREVAIADISGTTSIPFSYTHLTLPTICSV